MAVARGDAATVVVGDRQALVGQASLADSGVAVDDEPMRTWIVEAGGEQVELFVPADERPLERERRDKRGRADSGHHFRWYSAGSMRRVEQSVPGTRSGGMASNRVMKVPFNILDFLVRAETAYGDRIGIVDEPDQPAESLGELTWKDVAAHARAVRSRPRRTRRRAR